MDLQHSSWQTSSCGVAVIALGVLFVAIGWITGKLDAQGWTVAMMIFTAGIGLARARDNDKSSEDVGTKK